MSEGAWAVIGVVIGAIIAGVVNYVVQYQQRNWEIADARRKLRQEPLKQARQQVQDAASWVGKLAFGSISVSEVPGDVVGNLIVVLKYLGEKYTYALDQNRIAKARQLTNQSAGEEAQSVLLDICSEVLMWIDEAMEATFQ